MAASSETSKRLREVLRKAKDVFALCELVEEDVEVFKTEFRRVVWGMTERRSRARKAMSMIALACVESGVILQAIVEICGVAVVCNDASAREGGCLCLGVALEALHEQESDLPEDLWERIVDLLVPRTLDASVACRVGACRALKRCQDDVSRAALRKAFSTEAVASAREAVIDALEPRSKEDVDTLLKALRDKEIIVRVAAWRSFKEKGVKLAAVSGSKKKRAEIIAKGLKDTSQQVRFGALHVMVAEQEDLLTLIDATTADGKLVVRAARSLERISNDDNHFYEDNDAWILSESLKASFFHKDVVLTEPSAAVVALEVVRGDLVEPYGGLPPSKRSLQPYIDALRVFPGAQDDLVLQSVAHLAALLAKFRLLQPEDQDTVAKKFLHVSTKNLEVADAIVRFQDVSGHFFEDEFNDEIILPARAAALCGLVTLRNMPHTEKLKLLNLENVASSDPEIRKLGLAGLGRLSASPLFSDADVLFAQVSGNDLEETRVRLVALKALGDALLSRSTAPEDTGFLVNFLKPMHDPDLRDLAAQAAAKLVLRFQIVELLLDLLFALSHLGPKERQLVEEVLLPHLDRNFLRSCAAKIGTHSDDTEAIVEAVAALANLDDNNDEPSLAFIAIYETLAANRASDNFKAPSRPAEAALLARIARDRPHLSKFAKACAKIGAGTIIDKTLDPRNLLPDENDPPPSQMRSRRAAKVISYREETNDEKYFSDLRQQRKQNEKKVSATCAYCAQDDRPEELLLCDGIGCRSAAHINCLDPPLDAVPEEDWFCATCLATLDDDAPGGDHLLSATTPSSRRSSSLYNNEDDDNASAATTATAATVPVL